MFYVRKRNVSWNTKHMFDREKKKPDNNHFGGLNILMFTSIWFKLLIFQNKTSSPKDLEFTRNDCKQYAP